MKPMVVLVCVTAVLICGFMFSVVSGPIEAIRLSDASADAGEQEWAAGIWSSLRSSESSPEEAGRYFAEALRHARRKAPIYVSLGESGCGLSVFGKAVDTLTDQVTLAQALNAPNNPVDSFIEQIEQAVDDSTAAYLAAVREDPNCLIAWFRLANTDDRELAKRSAAQLMRLDPDNAIPYYAKAALEAESKTTDDALAAMTQGNAQPRCRLYQPEFPIRFRLRYPDSEAYRELGVAGESISPTALAFMVHVESEMMRFQDPFIRNLRNVVRRLAEEAEAYRDVGNLREAERRLDAIRDCGLHLIAEEGRDSLTMIVGSTYTGLAIEQIKAIVKETKNHEELEQQISIDEARMRFITAFQSALERMKPSDEILRLLFLGRIDWNARQRHEMDEAVRASGLQQWLIRRK